MRLCIIAGEGDLPVDILKEIKNQNIFTAIAIIDSFNKAENFDKADNIIAVKLGEVGKLLDFLQENQITQLIFAGSIKRPDLTSIIPDFAGVKLLANILKNKFLGDDNLLRAVLKFFEEKGYKIISAADILSSNITPGSLTKLTPVNEEMRDIEVGLQAFNVFGMLDIGQALIVSQGRVKSVEGAEGTDELIKRTKNYVAGKAVLIKLPKPTQDLRVDMPTIGPRTIEVMKESNINGLVINKEVIILSRQDTIDKANLNGIYIYVVN